MLCINGEQYDKLIMFKNCGRISRHIHVFARTSPSQKGIIVSLLNNEGHITLMCGDGTNDVGSLKRADVGLAIVNGVAPTKEQKKKAAEIKAGMNPLAMMKGVNNDPELKGKGFAEIQ
jgi:cation-transporting ATPase 13A1